MLVVQERLKSIIFVAGMEEWQLSDRKSSFDLMANGVLAVFKALAGSVEVSRSLFLEITAKNRR